MPAAAGGLEAHPATLVAAVRALAAGDAAAGWCVAIAATSGLVAGYLPEEAARAIYAGPATHGRGGVRAQGPGDPEPGGYRVSGRWPFASGCGHADWLMGGCVVDGGVRRAADARARAARRSRSTTPGT